jgi:hypothetical protein
LCIRSTRVICPNGVTQGSERPVLLSTISRRLDWHHRVAANQELIRHIIGFHRLAFPMNDVRVAGNAFVVAGNAFVLQTGRKRLLR